MTTSHSEAPKVGRYFLVCGLGIGLAIGFWLASWNGERQWKDGALTAANSARRMAGLVEYKNWDDMKDAHERGDKTVYSAVWDRGYAAGYADGSNARAWGNAKP